MLEDLRDLPQLDNAGIQSRGLVAKQHTPKCINLLLRLIVCRYVLGLSHKRVTP